MRVSLKLLVTLVIGIVLIPQMNIKYHRRYTPVRTRKLALQHYLDGESTEDIAERFSLSERTIKKYITRYEKTGTVLSEFELKKENGQKIERVKKFDNVNLSAFCDDKCNTDPTTPLSTYQSDIYGAFGIYASKSTLDRYFNNKNWKWKRISRYAFEADIHEIKLFWDYVGQILADKKQLIFIDESNRFDTTANPTYGRGPGYVQKSVLILIFSKLMCIQSSLCKSVIHPRWI